MANWEKYLRVMRIDFKKKVSLASCCLFLFFQMYQLQAQETVDPKKIIAQDKMVCSYIPTEIEGLEYQKSIKCLSKDSICYIIEGFSMSCIPRPPLAYPNEIPKLNPPAP